MTPCGADRARLPLSILPARVAAAANKVSLPGGQGPIKLRQALGIPRAAPPCHYFRAASNFSRRAARSPVSMALRAMPAR